MSDPEPRKPEPIFSDELIHELGETAATVTRLGVTLATLPLALLPDDSRNRVRALGREVLRIGSIMPRTIAAMLEEGADEASAKPGREDLGSRLRRRQREDDGEGAADKP